MKNFFAKTSHMLFACVNVHMAVLMRSQHATVGKTSLQRMLVYSREDFFAENAGIQRLQGLQLKLINPQRTLATRHA